MRQLNLAVAAIAHGVSMLARPLPIVPLAVYMLIQSLVLFLVVNFHLPGLVDVLAPAIRGLFGEAALHYPALFVVLPDLLGVSNIVVGALIGVYLWGVAVRLAARALAPDAAQDAWGASRRRYGQLFLAQLPVVAIALLLYFLPQAVFGGTELRGNALRAVRYGILGSGVAVEAVFLMAPMAVVLEGRNARRAIGRSFAFFRSNPVAALLVVGVPTLLHFPWMYVYRRSHSIVERFAPETVAIVVWTEILFYMVTNFILVVAATRAFLVAEEAA